MMLRPYQSAALDEIRRLYAAGHKKVLLVLATGGGKTLVFCEILKASRAKGKRCIMVVRGAELVDQASRRLDREDVPHGVMQANHWRRMPHEHIQICSIDTLYRRKLVPPADLIVIDEAHLATSPSFLWLISHYPNAFFLPVTATPFSKKGLRHVADAVVKPITMKELVDQGFLVPARYYIPSKLDLGNVRIDKKTYDYDQGELASCVKDPALYGDMLKAYRKLGENRPALCFAVNVQHSLEIVESFNQAGFRAVHVEAETPAHERADAIRKLESGEINVISNVGILTTGVDIPRVSCIIMARPTKSLNLYLQICGRGTRIAEGKKDFIILDHANNITEHGFIETERHICLDGKQSKPREEMVVNCSECFAAFNPYAVVPMSYICPYCSANNTPSKPVNEEMTRTRNTDQDRTVELIEVKSEEHFEDMKIDNYILSKVTIAAHKNYKLGWVYFQVKGRFGGAIANAYSGKIKERFVQAQARFVSQQNYFSVD